MDVNGVTSSTVSAYDYQKYANKESKTEEKKEEKAVNSEAAVYEASNKSAKETTSKVANPELVAKLKADSQAHIDQLQDIVNKLLSKQGDAYNKATGNLKDFYSSLNVDDATRAQAQKDIAEDGYWGVEQTSSRIFDFAMALSGGDAKTMEKMREAFQKGFKQATDAWGSELPEISQRTYGAVMQKFDDYAASMEAES